MTTSVEWPRGPSTRPSPTPAHEKEKDSLKLPVYLLKFLPAHPISTYPIGWPIKTDQSIPHTDPPKRPTIFTPKNPQTTR